MPALLTRMVPNLVVLVVFTVAVAAVVLFEPVPDPELGGFVVAVVGLDDPHAAMVRATTARAATAVPGRARRLTVVGASRPRRLDAVVASAWWVMALLP